MPPATTPTPAPKTTARQFLVDLAALRDKYPQCYIEPWMPADFRAATGPTASRGLTWNHPNAHAVADALYDGFDAAYGTSWGRIADAVDDR